MNQSLAAGGISRANPISLESALEELTKFGSPRVAMQGGTWHAAIEMNTTAAGADFTVRSDFKHCTPTSAVSQLHDRVKAIAAQRKGGE